MTRFIEFLISLLIVAALFLLIALFLPAKRSFVYSIETNRPMTTVYDLFNGVSRFKDWNPVFKYDPTMPTEISGPAMGVGAKISFQSRYKQIGNGSWEIVESVPGEMVKYKLVSPTRGDDKTMTFRFERTGQNNRNVKITQEYRVSYGWDLLGRFAGLYVTRNVGDDVKRGLDKFSTLLATIPKFDYSPQFNPALGEIKFEQVPAVDALVVTTASKRSNDEIATAMSNQLSWIEKVMQANGLESAGPLRIVTNEFTGDTYGFDVLMPVRKAGAGGAKSDADASEDSAAEAPAEAAPAEVGKLVINLEGPVTYEQVPARRVASTTYTGPAPGLPRARDVLRAWAMTHGANTEDRPYEEYLVPIPNMLDEDAKFNVHWPVKN